jgi:hypothetical protein
MLSSRGAPPWVVTARDLYLVAMAVFVVNIVIGILNGADVVEFDRNQILTHVHAGTVGWLTLTIVASTFLLFRTADRRLMLALAILVPIYVLAFYTGNFAFRAVGGVALLAAIAWLLWWLWQTYLAGERTLPRLAVVLGLTSFGYGALIGVLIQASLAAGVALLPGDAIGAHASAMTFGYLVLVAMGFIEWRILRTRDLPRAGMIQIGALFLGGLVISISLLAGATQAGGGIYLLTQLIAVVLFAIRILPRSLRVNWAAADPIRHFAASSIWVVVALILFMYIVFTFISAGATLQRSERCSAGPPERADRERPLGLHRDRDERRPRTADRLAVASQRSAQLDRAGRVLGRQPRTAGIRDRPDRQYRGDQADRRAGHGHHAAAGTRDPRLLGAARAARGDRGGPRSGDLTGATGRNIEGRSSHNSALLEFRTRPGWAAA